MNDWIAYFGPQNRYRCSSGELKITNETLTVFESGHCRFPNDRLMVQDERFVIVIDSLILNRKELFENYHTEDFAHLVAIMYREHPDDFFRAFRGPFTGLIYDQEKHRAVVFTNQTGDSAVFCYRHNGIHVFSSNFYLLSQFLKENALPTSFGVQAAHWMLSFGFQIDAATFIEEVHRLLPGKAMYLDNGHWRETTYHRFQSRQIDIREDEAVERIDVLFRQAVKRCFDKDLEYGYTHHLADISAGMDSRMVNVVAKALGYDNITNISYSQNGNEEERLAQKATRQLENKLIFKALDNHEFIFDLEKLTRMDFGTYLYCGITGGEQLLSEIDFNIFGAEQTGQLGDIAIGTFVKTASNAVNPNAVRCSSRLSLDDRYETNPEHYENQDLYSLYTRGFLGAMSSWFVRKNYTFALSPFIDVDFLGFCYDLPLDYRRNHHLYWKWVERYYPDALTVPTSRKRLPKTFFEKSVDFGQRGLHKALRISHKALHGMGLTPSSVSARSSMNPYQYWYDTDPAMRTFFGDYYSKNLSLLDNFPETAAEVRAMFESPVVLDKIMALTVLAARNVFF